MLGLLRSGGVASRWLSLQAQGLKKRQGASKSAGVGDVGN